MASKHFIFLVQERTTFSLFLVELDRSTPAGMLGARQKNILLFNFSFF